MRLLTARNMNSVAMYGKYREKTLSGRVGRAIWRSTNS